MYELLNMDCRDVLANMADDSVDSIVTDPPYHLTSIVKRFGPGQAPAQFGTDGAFARAARGFMGQTWDGGDIAFDPELWAECLRVLKPGGHLLAFSGTRTYHRMAYAIDAAGFEIRDMLSWLYGSGFPKSHDVSKAIDKAAGAEREVIGFSQGRSGPIHGGGQSAGTPEAQQWAGWGTALKPACEPICMARKPLIGAVAANVLAHGTGAINIDGCRVPTNGEVFSIPQSNPNNRGGVVGSDLGISKTDAAIFQAAQRASIERTQSLGRFPANVLHDGSDEVVALFPAQAGAAAPVRGTEPSEAVASVYNERARVAGAFHGDSGSAARFFYCAKASKADREVGCENIARGRGDPEQFDSRWKDGTGDERKPDGRANTHPTVKPTDLMRWLVRLVTPPGGLVFDPFTGSGSTGRAAILEGCRFIGAELTPEYVPIARARIDAAVNGK